MGIRKTAPDFRAPLEFETLSIWHAPVLGYDAVAADPQVQYNGNLLQSELTSGEPITLLAHPACFDGERPGVRLAPQPIGAQSAEILSDLGYDDATVSTMESSGAVALG